VTFVLATGGSVGMLGLDLLRWPVQAATGWFYVVIVFMLSLVLFAFSALMSLIHCFMHWPRHRLMATLPLLLVGLTAWSWWSGAGQAGVRAVDHRLHGEARLAVVALVEAGELQTERYSSGEPKLVSYGGPGALYVLPRELSHLSHGGSIIVGRDGPALEVTFFATLDGLGEYTGWVYRSDGRAPRLGRVVEQRDGRWFFVGMG
jgi:hypothetical protein